MNNQSPLPDWDAGTWEGSRRTQIRRSLQLTVRERLQALEAISEASDRLAQAGAARRLVSRAQPPHNETGPDDRIGSGRLPSKRQEVTPDTERRQEALGRYCARLRHDIGDALDSLFIYGSQARGDAVAGSDIDVLVVVNEAFDYGEMLDRTSVATAEISLEYDVVVSRVFVTRADYVSRQTPFLNVVRCEAVRV